MAVSPHPSLKPSPPRRPPSDREGQGKRESGQEGVSYGAKREFGGYEHHDERTHQEYGHSHELHVHGHGNHESEFAHHGDEHHEHKHEAKQEEARKREDRHESEMESRKGADSFPKAGDEDEY